MLHTPIQSPQLLAQSYLQPQPAGSNRPQTFNPQNTNNLNAHSTARHYQHPPHLSLAPKIRISHLNYARNNIDTRELANLVKTYQNEDKYGGTDDSLELSLKIFH